jgi:hypothetical protein
MATTSRRKALRTLGYAAGGVAAAGLGKPRAATSEVESEAFGGWTYERLDATGTADRAYALYPGKGCMYAVFKGIVGQLADRHGAPYTSFPFEMMQYGHGGMGGYGCTCGAANGAASVLGLFHQQKRTRDLLITELFKWYEQTELPRYRPVPGEVGRTMPTSKSDSVLCHASIANWCRVADVDPYDKWRSERCRRLSADVAAKTVELLNRTEQSGPREITLTDGSARCMECHVGAGHAQLTVRARMNCASCHQ